MIPSCYSCHVFVFHLDISKFPVIPCSFWNLFVGSLGLCAVLGLLVWLPRQRILVKKHSNRFEGVASVSDVSNYHIDYIIKLYLSQLNFRGHKLFECSLLLGKCSEMPLIGETCIFFNSPWISCAFCLGYICDDYSSMVHFKNMKPTKAKHLECLNDAFEFWKFLKQIFWLDVAWCDGILHQISFMKTKSSEMKWHPLLPTPS